MVDVPNAQTWRDSLLAKDEAIRKLVRERDGALRAKALAEALNDVRGTLLVTQAELTSARMANEKLEARIQAAESRLTELLALANERTSALREANAEIDQLKSRLDRITNNPAMRGLLKVRQGVRRLHRLVRR